MSDSRFPPVASRLAREILDAVRTPLAVLDARGRVLAANRAFYTLLDVTRAETEGASLLALGGGALDVPSLRTGLQRLLDDGSPLRDVDVIVERPDHRVFQVDARRIDELNGTIVSLEDHTQARTTSAGLRDLADALEEKVERRTALLHLLQEVTIAAHDARSVRDAMESVLAAVCRHTGWCVSHVYRRSGDDAVPTGIWFADETQCDPGAFVDVTADTRYPLGHGLVGRVLAEGEPLWLDLVDAPGPRPDALERAGLRAVALCPVVREDTVVAVLEFFGDRPSDLATDPRFGEALRTVGLQLGSVVERKQIEHELSNLSAREARRLGRDLHDSLGQQIAGLAMLTASLEKKLAARGAPEAAYAAELREAAAEAKQQVRRIARGLAPVEVDARGLMRALDDLAGASASMFRIRCEFRCTEPVPVEDNRTATHLYRIAQEAVRNAVEHGKAEHVLVALARERDWVRLEVRDDGVGFEPSAPSNGLGLRTMRHRASLIGADLTIERLDRGMVVRCTLPHTV